MSFQVSLVPIIVRGSSSIQQDPIHVSGRLPIRDLRERIAGQFGLVSDFFLIANGVTMQIGWTLADYENSLHDAGYNIKVVLTGKEARDYPSRLSQPLGGAADVSYFE